MGLAHFSIGTATDRIDLLRNIRVVDWDPSGTPIEDTWASSALAEGRQLASHRYLNAIEDMGLHVIAPTQDKVIEWSQNLRRMLRRAREYWDTEHQTDIVYIMAQAKCETNMRYCWVHSGNVPKDNDPFGQPFTGGPYPRFWNRQFIFERGAWLANSPGEGTAILTEGSQVWCFPSYLEFDGAAGDVDCWNDAKLNNLPDNGVSGKGPVTIEAWIRATGWGGTNVGRIVDKGPPIFFIDIAAGLSGYVFCNGGAARSDSGLDEFTVDGEWHYVLMTYSEVGAAGIAARTVYLNIDGTWVTTYALQNVSAGVYPGDAANHLSIGDNGGGANVFEGDIGWVRVSNNIRYNPGAPAPFTDFTPPVRCTLPDIDANTMGQWIKEGQGTGVGAVANQSGGTAGDLTGATWDCDCPETYGYVPPVGGTGATGWWDPLDEGFCVWGAWQARGAANFAASLVDLTGNSNDLGDPGGGATPGWDAVNGWTFDGLNDYLTSTFIPANDQGQSMLCQFTGWVDGPGNLMLAGSYTIAPRTYFTLAPDNGNIVMVGNGQQKWWFGIPFNTGNLGVAGDTAYKNGLPLAGAIPTYSAPPTFPVFVGALNNNGAGASDWAEVKMRALVIYDCVLSAAEMLRVQTAMAAL